MKNPLLLLSVPALVVVVGCNNTSPEYLGILNQAENSPEPQKQIKAIEDLVRYHWDQESALQTVMKLAKESPNREVKSAAKIAVVGIMRLKQKSADETNTAILLLGS